MKGIQIIDRTYEYYHGHKVKTGKIFKEFVQDKNPALYKIKYKGCKHLKCIEVYELDVRNFDNSDESKFFIKRNFIRQ